MRIGLIGVGATGARAARQLSLVEDVASLVLVDQEQLRAQRLAEELGTPASYVRDVSEAIASSDIVVVAAGENERSIVRAALEAKTHVVSTNDSLDEVASLLELDDLAKANDVCVAVGAGFAPGFSCLLAKHGAASFDVVDEVHVAKFGTGGPTCARNHHKSLSSEGLDWKNGAWHQRPGGSGRELVWFPDPVGGRDCYRAALADGLLLQPAFTEATRITSRVAATRRDRLTSALPMMRQPHPEGLEGAIRVELRGSINSARVTRIYGVVERPALAAGTVAATVALMIGRHQLTFRGSAGLATAVDDAGQVLKEIAHRGIDAQLFEGDDD